MCSPLMRLTGDINVMKSALYERQAKNGGRKLLSPNRHRRHLPQIRSELSSKHRAGDILENLPNLTEVDSNHQEEQAEDSEDEDPSPALLAPFSATPEAWEEGDHQSLSEWLQY